MNWNKQGTKAMGMLKDRIDDIDVDDLLQRIGLRRRSSGWATFFGSLGVFAAGALVGAGVGMLFAPKAGTELRSDVAGKLRSGAETLKDSAQSINSRQPVV